MVAAHSYSWLTTTSALKSSSLSAIITSASILKINKLSQIKCELEIEFFLHTWTCHLRWELCFQQWDLSLSLWFFPLPSPIVASSSRLDRSVLSLERHMFEMECNCMSVPDYPDRSARIIFSLLQPPTLFLSSSILLLLSRLRSGWWMESFTVPY